ncbi:endopeptidase La [Candidatus Haliotispira prima]|uniref:Lon protease n=1 Tax=Candidatus Haliotispira prima TaxID=3034016 RepID=A0ABY8MDQ0_9SPIO|nr:endopeptidase La [Candidatus Haliotispira prima]
MANNEIIIANKDLPSELLIIPMVSKPLFPGIFTPILINEADDIALVEKAYEGDRTIGLVLTRETEEIRPESTNNKSTDKKSPGSRKDPGNDRKKHSEVEKLKTKTKAHVPRPETENGQEEEEEKEDFTDLSEDLEYQEDRDETGQSASGQGKQKPKGFSKEDETDNNSEQGLEYEESQELYDIGTVARISRKINLPDGNINIFITTLKRFRIKLLNSDTYPLLAEVEYLDDILPEKTDELKGLTRALLSEMKRLAENNPLFTEEMRLNMVNIDSPGTIADFTASILNLPREVQQEILEELDVFKRMEHVLIYIKREQDLLNIQRKVAQRINQKIEKSQREYFLREEIKTIKKELGEPSDARSSDAIKFQEKIARLKLSEEVLEQVNSELEKFSLMEPSSAEYTVTRNYLDTIVNLPWDAPKPDRISLKKAERILNRDHYSLEDVKKRILEYLAVRYLKQDARGAIICLVGPPGVGKTSIGKSIARTLERPFYRFSVGGMRDEAEIKGHRRTYVGAMPGKLIQGLKVTKTQTPVFMIDEIDKLGSSYQGDPSSALLEALDPEQNSEFRDHYLDLPFDLSHVLFVTTANTLEGIPSPLLDRMEVIRLSGYILEEKVEIAKRHLIPRSLERHGMSREQISYALPALRGIANGYAREAGMRNYEKALDRIHRKIAYKIGLSELENEEQAGKLGKPKMTDAAPNTQKTAKEVKNGKTTKEKTKEKTKGKKVFPLYPLYGQPIKIEAKDLEEYLKKPHFTLNPQRMVTQPGMVTGLAWTGMGGDTLVIESLELIGRGELKLTGQMGDVMKESAAIAYSVAKNYLGCCGESGLLTEEAQAIRLPNTPAKEVHGEVQGNTIRLPRWAKSEIHLHIPEGATPKDGPSAGITMATCILSLLSGQLVDNNFTMTGELSLTGQVLPIGGLREKTIAAKRYNMKNIIIPQQNLRDLDEIPDYVKKGMRFYPVSEFAQVVALLLPKMTRDFTALRSSPQGKAKVIEPLRF